MFWFPHVYKSYVYTILSFIKCAALFPKKKNNVHTLIKKYFIAKNKTKQNTITWAFGKSSVSAGGGSFLSVESCSLIKVVVAEAWGWCGSFLK